MKGSSSDLEKVCIVIGKVLQLFPSEPSRPVFLVFLALSFFLLTVHVLKKKKIFVLQLLKIKTTFDSFVLCTFAVGFYCIIVMIGFVIAEMALDNPMPQKHVKKGKLFFPIDHFL